jgi:NAD(P)-dependent dehydrogenase (short-subunit alcohol dehydrogenase family)
MHMLAGKVAVVTGAARGIGLGLARAFAEERMRIVVSDINAIMLEEAVASLRSAGAEVIGVPADITDDDAILRLRDATYEHFGTAHVLCNNGGPAASNPLDQPVDIAQWNRAMDLLVCSVLRGINAFLPRMIEQGDGHIVNTASRAALVPVPVLGVYSPAKSAVLSLSEVLHANLAERGAAVGVSVLTPGFVRSEHHVAASDGGEQKAETDPAVRAFIEERMANAVDPIDVGRLTVRAVQQNALYINTHRETFGWLQERVNRMVADADRIGTIR